MNDPLHVCLVSAAYRPYPSGISEHVHYLAGSLRDLGHHVTILTTRFAGPDEAPSGVRVCRLGRAVRIPLNRSFATLPVGLRLAGQVQGFLARRPFDVVHCHGMFWPDISYWALRHSRAVNLITALMAGFRIHTLGCRPYRRLFRRHLDRIHGRIAVSKRARAAIEPYVPGDYRLIPCGVDVERFRTGLEPLPSEPRGRPSILFVGRLDARKGVDVLLRSMPDILHVRPETRLVVVGDGPLREKAKGLARALGVSSSVQFEGVVSSQDVPRYYAGADLFCSPALGGESLGIVLLEAMAAGAAVVASDIPGYDETVESGANGLLFPPGNSRALAEAVLTVSEQPGLRQRLVAAGRERSRGFAWPVVAAQTEQYYRDLLASAAATAGSDTSAPPSGELRPGPETRLPPSREL